MTIACSSISTCTLIPIPSLIGGHSSVHVMLNCATVWARWVWNKSLRTKARKESRENLKRAESECKEHADSLDGACGQQIPTGQVSWCLVPDVLPGGSWAFTDGWGQVWRRSRPGMYTRRLWHICSAAKHRSTLAGQNVDCMEGRPHTCTTTRTHRHAHTPSGGEERHDSADGMVVCMAAFCCVWEWEISHKNIIMWHELDPWPTKSLFFQ